MQTRKNRFSQFAQSMSAAPYGAIVLFAAATGEGAEQPDAVIAQVIVTAERRPQEIQSVPLSITAVTAADIRSFNMLNTVDLPAAVPGLNFTQQGIGATPFIRGVGSMSGAIGNESSVSVYVDGVYIAAPTADIFSLYDAAQVEVLKGPQGTLFGRNATGGVIQIVRRDPSSEPSTEVRVQRSSYSTTDGSIYGTTDLGDNLAASMTLHHREQQRGWGTNLATGESTFRHDETGAATKIVWTPGSQTRVVLSGSYFDRTGEDGIGYHIVPGSLAADGKTTFGGFYNSWGSPQDRGGYRHAVFSARLEQDLSSFRLINTVSWQELNAFFRLDQDETPLRIVDAPITQYGRTLTEELQALSSADSAWQWIVGAYYLHDISAYNPLSLQGIAALPFASLNIYSEQRTDSYAIYGQTTAHLTSRTHLTLGARYTYDGRDIDSRTVGAIDEERATLNPVQKSATWKKPTWRLALSRDFTDDLMAYVSWDRGFKSGVFNLLNYASPPVHPEVLDAYQAGVKSEWLEHRLRFNVAGFWYQYENIQVESIVAGATVSVNAAAARMKGIEVDLDYLPTSRVSLRAGLALLDGRYTDFAEAPINVPNRDAAGNLTGGNTVIAGDARGNRTVRSPRTTASLHGGYRIPTRAGEIDLGVSYAYSTNFAWDPDNRLQQRAYELVSASIGWTSPSEALGVRASGTNLTNSEVSVFTLASALGDFGTPRPPRTFSLELIAKF
jgi:iron complex outermembrane recepter protein